ncbi:MAG: alanine--tRNA ligase [Nitrososphaerota archaeon]|nr:alanine--tRNA ligase [Candidatus Bathyarchaeota archaeon]MDW8061458.1 alanine--tRNA ligase [Nitrososphaerota archaeon]
MSGIYEVEVFRSEGFKRRRCPSCGRFFWSVDEDQVYCGDQPCVEYSFIGNPITGVRYRLEDMREAFLSFFERNGHRRVRRYPVVARWREDVYLVGASIYAFQPWVTEGIAPPPENPLTISQPCIRLTDLPKVGRTGRHLTSFEMMAHHAFNTKDETVYWNDETVEYCYRFYKDVLKVPAERITFIEDWWSGGGNAGEDFEVVIGGAEVATLVFMHYRDRDGALEEMPVKVVDTGYGLERNVWVCLGSPTIYDAVHREFIDRVTVEAGIPKVDERILVEISKASGRMDAISDAEYQVADRLGVSVEELRQVMKPYTAVYALADHTYTIAWMLCDGIVPSNTGAGYLARLLIRRGLRFLREIGLETPLSDFIDFQISRIARSYPEVGGSRSKVLDMVDLESERYSKTLSEAPKVIERTIAREGRKHKLTLTDLVELYDSYGIPPEVSEEYASKLGVEVEKGDFYTLLASRHSKPEEVRMEEKPVSKLIHDLPPTRTLYYEDPDMLTFKAKVLRAVDRYIILDSTCFYPEGGGAISDTGVIRWVNGELRVVGVEKVDGIIVHIVEGPLPPVGVEVEGYIDRERRKHIRRHHTATHILIGAARRLLGSHVWQMGSLKSIDYARLDISHYKRLSLDELKALEKMANDVVGEARRVNVYWMPRDKAESMYGFTLYQGGVFPGKILRVVEIEGWDAEACGGIHCSSTSEVGFVKIIGAERIQDGVERIHFTAGEASLRYVWSIEDTIRNLSDILSAPIDKLVPTVDNLLGEVKSLRREIRKLKERMAESIATGYRSFELKGGVKVSLASMEGDPETVIKVGEKMLGRDPSIIAIFLIPGDVYRLVVMAGDDAIARGFDAGRVASIIARATGGVGGGKARLGQGGKLNPTEAEKLLSDIDRVRSILESIGS